MSPFNFRPNCGVKMFSIEKFVMFLFSDGRRSLLSRQFMLARRSYQDNHRATTVAQLLSLLLSFLCFLLNRTAPSTSSTTNDLTKLRRYKVRV